nr:hypothetical protein CFP56_00944 [Quercus suber]
MCVDGHKREKKQKTWQGGLGKAEHERKGGGVKVHERSGRDGERLSVSEEFCCAALRFRAVGWVPYVKREQGHG